MAAAEGIVWHKISYFWKNLNFFKKRLAFFWSIWYYKWARRSGGMADALDSGSSEVTLVWVQLPSSAWFIKTWTRWESLEIKGSYFVFTIDSKDNDWTRPNINRIYTRIPPKKKGTAYCRTFLFLCGQSQWVMIK